MRNRLRSAQTQSSSTHSSTAWLTIFAFSHRHRALAARPTLPATMDHSHSAADNLIPTAPSLPTNQIDSAQPLKGSILVRNVGDRTGETPPVRSRQACFCSDTHKKRKIPDVCDAPEAGAARRLLPLSSTSESKTMNMEGWLDSIFECDLQRDESASASHRKIEIHRQE